MASLLRLEPCSDVKVALEGGVLLGKVHDVPAVLAQQRVVRLKVGEEDDMGGLEAPEVGVVLGDEQVAVLELLSKLEEVLDAVSLAARQVKDNHAGVRVALAEGIRHVVDSARVVAHGLELVDEVHGQRRLACTPFAVQHVVDRAVIGGKAEEVVDALLPGSQLRQRLGVILAQVLSERLKPTGKLDHELGMVVNQALEAALLEGLNTSGDVVASALWGAASGRVRHLHGIFASSSRSHKCAAHLAVARDRLAAVERATVGRARVLLGGVRLVGLARTTGNLPVSAGQRSLQIADAHTLVKLHVALDVRRVSLRRKLQLPGDIGLVLAKLRELGRCIRGVVIREAPTLRGAVAGTLNAGCHCIKSHPKWWG